MGDATRRINKRREGWITTLPEGGKGEGEQRNKDDRGIRQRLGGDVEEGRGE